MTWRVGWSLWLIILAQWAFLDVGRATMTSGRVFASERGSSLRVIVKLSAPVIIPESALSNDAYAKHLQRLDIANRQDGVLFALAQLPYRVLWRYATTPYLAIETTPNGLQALWSSPFVEDIIADFELEQHLAQSGSIVQSSVAHNVGITGTGQTIIVVDDGIDSRHAFFGGRVVEEWCFNSPNLCPNGESSQTGVGAAAPSYTHGTHVAGIAAGSGATFSGVAPAASILMMRIFPPIGNAMFSDLKAALDRIKLIKDTRPIASVNLSLGTPSVFQFPCDAMDAAFGGLKQDIDDLRAVGIATVVSAGNNGSVDALTYPACLSGTIKAVATTKSDGVAFYSNRALAAESTTLLAPGGDASTSGGIGNICSSRSALFDTTRGVCDDPGTDGTFGFEAGTSMAAPHVAGAWALLKQVKPTATVDEVLGALRSTAATVLDPSTGTSYKRIRVRDAVAALTGLSVTLSADKRSPQRVPVTVQFTATAAGGVGPIQFKWWVYDGTDWSLLRDWSTNSVLGWTPTRANRAYQIYVRAKSATILADGYDGVASNATLDFVIDTVAAATLVSPSTTLLNSRPTYTWNAVLGSTWYQLWVDDSRGARVIQWYTADAVGCPGGTGTCSVTPSVALGAGPARWWVQTWSVAGIGPWSVPLAFTISAPGIAALVAPSSSTLTDPMPTYTWTAVLGSSWYQLWVDDSTGTRITQWYTAGAAGCSAGTGTCAVTPSVALRAGAVRWWIRTWSDVGFGPWSNAMAFTVSAPGMATLVSPTATMANRTPTYTWNAVAGSTSYQLWVDDSTGNRIVQWYTATSAGCQGGLWPAR